MSPRPTAAKASKRALAGRAPAKRARKSLAPAPSGPALLQDQVWSRGLMILATLLGFVLVQFHAQLFPDDISGPVLYLLVTGVLGIAAFQHAPSWSLWRAGLAAASLPFWGMAVHLSTTRYMDVGSFAYYGAAMALAGFAAAGAPRDQPADGGRSPWPATLATPVLLLLGLLALKGVLRYNNIDGSVMGAWPARGISANDILSSRFHDPRLLLPVLLCAFALTAYHFGVWRRQVAAPLRMILALACLVFVAKLAIAAISTQGAGLFGVKVASENNNFFTFASKLEGWKGFFHLLGEFNQRQAALGGHLDTHPPLSIAFYLLLFQVFGGSAQLSGLFVAALTSLTVVPVFLLGRRLYGVEAGYAGAMLYGFSTSSLGLSSAGVDCVAALLIALALWSWVAALQDRSLKLAFLAGLFYGFNQYFNFGSSHLLALFGLLWAWLGFRGEGTARRKAGLLLLFGLGLLLPHLLVWLASGMKFDYRQMVDTALNNHRQVNKSRVYGLWLWVNVLLVFAYMGYALVVGWFARSGRLLARGAAADPYAVFVMMIFFTQAASGMARMEVNRQWLYTVIYVAPLAGAGIAGLRGRWPVLLFSLANLAQAALLEVLWIDAN